MKMLTKSGVVSIIAVSLSRHNTEKLKKKGRDL
jgi:hypothetical protein